MYKVNACGGKSASGDDETVGLDFVNNVCGEGHARLARQRGVLIEVYTYSRVELCPARNFAQGNLRIAGSLRYFAYRYGDDIALYSLLKPSAVTCTLPCQSSVTVCVPLHRFVLTSIVAALMHSAHSSNKTEVMVLCFIITLIF